MTNSSEIVAESALFYLQNISHAQNRWRDKESRHAAVISTDTLTTGTNAQMSNKTALSCFVIRPRKCRRPWMRRSSKRR